MKSMQQLTIKLEPPFYYEEYVFCIPRDLHRKCEIYDWLKTQVTSITESGVTGDPYDHVLIYGAKIKTGGSAMFLIHHKYCDYPAMVITFVNCPNIAMMFKLMYMV